MIEKKIFQEIPGGKNKFHSAILTSFSFNFHHFEYQVLKSLKHKWITNVGVLVDSNMLDQSAGLTSAGLKQLTQSYSVNGVYCKGAFHPKINFIIGDTEILMIIGSGNITPGGHGKNHETFTSFYADKENKTLLPLILEGWEYLKYLAKDIEGFSRDRIYNVIPKNCELLTDKRINKHNFYKIDEETEIALIYNDSTSILKQLINLLPVDTIESITILCPYFDEDGTLLIQLLNSFPSANLKVYLPEHFGLPPTGIKSNKRITFYKWEDTERGKVMFKGKEAYKRKLHSKVFNFHSKDFNYFLIGSANATLAGFGSEGKRGINEEFGALYKTKKIDFFKILAILGSKKTAPIASYLRTENLNPDNKNSFNQTHNFKILSCDLIGLSLKIYLKDLLAEKLLISFFNDMGQEIYTISDYSNESKTISFKIIFEQLKLNPVYISLKNEDGKIKSNKQIINYLDKLYDTDPSKENRTIKGLIGALEIGKINEFKLLSYLNDLNSNATVSNSKSSFNSANNSFPPEPLVHSEMTYEEAVEASKNKESSTKLSKTHNTIRIWEVISQLFKDNIEKENEELNDEEEDGSAEKSNERPSTNRVKTNQEIKDDSQTRKIILQTEKLTKDFIDTIQKITQDKNHLINEISLVQFLVVTHIITVIHYFTEYDLPYNEKTKRYKGYTHNEWKKILVSKYHDLIKVNLETFGYFILSHQFEDVSDNEIRRSKMEDYKQKVICHIIIYHYLVHKNKPENPLSQSLDLVCLNLFHKLGLPDEHCDEYINSIIKSNFKTKYFPYNVLKLKMKLIADFNKIDSKNKHFFHNQYGVCLILEKTSSKIYFKSLLNTTVKFELPLKAFTYCKLI